jgi:hypothetical protein
MPSEASSPFKYLGLLQDYNGVDVQQTADYIELSAVGCIDRVLQSHRPTDRSRHIDIQAFAIQDCITYLV